MRIVVTGGICTGKSTVCKILNDMGFEIVDADKIAHETLEKNISSIKELFGEEYIKGSEVDRKKLGNLVFFNEKERKKLEKLLHPLIKERIEKLSKEFNKKSIKHILDIPLYFETSNYDADKVILIYAPKEVQIERIKHRDGLSLKEAKKRVEAQMDIENKRELADIVVQNTGDLNHLKKELKKVIDADFKI